MRILYIPNKLKITPVKFGLLYNWYALTDSRGMAPSGWHLATKSDYETLATYLGGASVAGGKMKATGTDFWMSPNTDADNSSGFTGKGAGYRLPGDGAFSYFKENGIYITPTLEYGAFAVHADLVNNAGSINITYGQKRLGASVRYVKDNSTDPGSVTDYDGNVYETVKIGDQVWSKSNLIVKKYNNGDSIENVTDATTWAGLTSGAWCYYDNDSGNM